MPELISPACQSALVYKLQADTAEELYRCQNCQVLLQQPKRRDKKAVAVLGLLVVAAFMASPLFSDQLF